MNTQERNWRISSRSDASRMDPMRHLLTLTGRGAMTTAECLCGWARRLGQHFVGASLAHLEWDWYAHCHDIGLDADDAARQWDDAVRNRRRIGG